jgi:hypothetical protein
MKILKKGNAACISWIGKCTKCQTIFKANESELLNISLGDYRSDYEDFAWEECKCCTGSLSKRVCFHKVNTKSGKQLLAQV